MVLKSRDIIKKGQVISEVLVKWNNQSEEDATWENAIDFKNTYPDFILEDKDISKAGAIVAIASPSVGYKTVRRSARKIRGCSHTKFRDFVMK